MFKIHPDSKDFISSLFLKGRALASLLPLISPLVTLQVEGLFAGTCKVSETVQVGFAFSKIWGSHYDSK